MRRRAVMIERKAIKDRFKGKVAIVTGGASGIGRAIVEELCKEGAAVCFTGISEVGNTTAKQLEKAGFDAYFLRGDMENSEFSKSVTPACRRKFGKVNFLVNNAFSFIAKGTEATSEDWDRMMRVGPIAYSFMAASVVEPMKEQGGGAIVNMSSISAFIAQKNRWTYNAAKGAVHTLTKCMAYDLAQHNIRVNSVSPGWIWTREVFKAAAIDGGGKDKWDPIWGEYHMLGRCGEPIECAGPVLFLLSDDASFVTATDLAIDGGYQGMGPEGLGKTTVLAGSK
jgi:NAD(P)-dependent dehydrogenase (short-subunit alcohol dehydrogenase family)